jgi:CheY-like chemotaxis protein
MRVMLEMVSKRRAVEGMLESEMSDPFMEDSKYTILLVEDEENDARLVQMAFKKNGILNPVHWAKDGLEAIAYLNGEGAYGNRERYPFPEVLILDLKMPRMTGLELLAWIRDHPAFKVIPTIIMTSSRQDPDVEKAYELGANTYMIKPSSFAELAKMVQLAHEYWAVSVKPSAKWQKRKS